MNIYKASKDYIEMPVVLALGNFDGVHTGHKKLLDAAKSIASRTNSCAGVYTFEINSKILLGAKNISLLTTDKEKNDIMSDYGMDFVVYDDFEFVKDFQAESFCDYLSRIYNLTAVVCGENYTFGKNASCGCTELEAMMKKRGVYCETVPDYTIDGKTVSSTAIRKYISDGKMDDAGNMLGYRYFIDSEVIHGAALGRKLGFPTINQKFYDGKAVPSFGVYACRCTVDGKAYMGVTNVGVKPTVNGYSSSVEPTAETNIIDFDGDLYGKTVKIEFFKKLRDEKKFSSLDELKECVLKNIEETKIYFGKDINIK